MKCISIVGVIVALVLAGCATQSREHESTTAGHQQGAASSQSRGADHPGMMGSSQMMTMCPAQVPGTTMHAEDVPGGTAVVFTTTGDVAELRRRVSAMVEMHDTHAGAEGAAACCAPGQGANMPQREGMTGHGMMGGMMMPASEARIEEIPGGARVVLQPRDPAQLDALRQHVAQMAARMSSGSGCPMMSTPEARKDAPPEAEHDHNTHQDTAPK